jgi:hypothetical protein
MIRRLRIRHHVPGAGHGCQIYLGAKYQNGENYTKLTLNYQMVIEYTDLFHSQALQYLPKLGFLVRKYTIGRIFAYWAVFFIKNLAQIYGLLFYMETCFVSMSSSKMSNVKWQPVNDNVDLI